MSIEDRLDAVSAVLRKPWSDPIETARRVRALAEAVIGDASGACDPVADAGGGCVEIDPRVAAFWGKSADRAGGCANPLVQHLFDTAAVAELLWDRFLAPSTRLMLDEVAGGAGAGRRLFCWLCGIHDVGKATPPFQRLDTAAAGPVGAAGLSWPRPVPYREWRHDRAGGRMIVDRLLAAGWSEEQVDWVWPLVAGHHGAFPGEDDLFPPENKVDLMTGDRDWLVAQEALMETVTRAVGFASVSEVRPAGVPSRAAQLQISGLIVMADWIASDQEFFTGVADPAALGMASARGRAVSAWQGLGLRGGWGDLPLPGPGLFRERFGQDPRPSQEMVLRAAHAMEAPGLLLVEAPMGEGKTKAALCAAEVLAARFGADGAFLGMPTQATCDPMFTLVREWVGGIDAALIHQVALLHGKRMFNDEWTSMRAAVAGWPGGRFAGVDACGADCHGDPADGAAAARGSALAEWFLTGRHRGLLSPFVVGTIDQLLFAATRTRHVMLRMAGLAGKVVVLDEVHAADVYMSQFLREALRWLGQAGTPVVMLSATLASGQRRELVGAYLAGAASRAECDVAEWAEPSGYPCVTSAWWDGGRSRVVLDSAPAWREVAAAGAALVPVRLEVLPERVCEDDRGAAQDEADVAVADLLSKRLVEGGCALVIRNTVDRAQTLARLLRGRFPADEVALLHGRLTVRERADRTDVALSALGPPDAAGAVVRPGRMILVATQLAEQSFDVDADLLVTDLAPVDLLLQRVGRLHRHAGVARPERVREPCVVVTGFSAGVGADGVPGLLGASEVIYGRWPLLRTAALVVEGAAGVGWRIPVRVPELVARVYEGAGGVVPPSWRAAEAAALAEWEKSRRERVGAAGKYVLTRLGEHEHATLEGLHFAGSLDGGEAGLEAAVRDGKRSIEVILVEGEGGGCRTLAGRELGSDGAAVGTDLLEEVLGSTVRLSAGQSKAAASVLEPLPGWLGDPWLRYSPALVVDRDGRAVVGDYTLRYDRELGLVQEAGPRHRGRPFRR